MQQHLSVLCSTSETGNVSDEQVVGTTLLSIIDYNALEASITNIIVADRAEITIPANNITEMLTDINDKKLTITNQKITVTGKITASQANKIASKTDGLVTATILETESLDQLASLKADNVTNAYEITVSDTTAIAQQLNNLNNLTTKAINLGNVTSLDSSSLQDLETLANAILDTNNFVYVY